ncbi:Alpha/Beta hydrolase protein [Xylariales sp. PMI_506]|nr:Alpha/Beta hydrolase protein [Xylariales sp. PMI_506]
MDKVREAIARHGNVWTPQTNTDMNELYEPLHVQQAHKFVDTVKVEKGVKYGDHERHRLDIYTPVRADATDPLPVVVFFHGGAFIIGDNDITPSMHGNIANFCASNGCIGVLGTYRLLPEARYPSGGQDCAQALRWVQDHISEYGGSPQRITAVGQSAGGAHMASALYGGHLAAAGVKLSGLVLLSPPLWYDLSQARRRENMVLYHGTDSDEEILSKAGAAVFSRSEGIEEPRLLQMVGELDSNEIVDGNLAFVDAYRKKHKRLPLFEVMKGHNHISNILEIGLPSDTVGPRILAFAKEQY